MSLNSLIKWILGVILVWSSVRHVDDIHRGILKAQVQL